MSQAEAPRVEFPVEGITEGAICLRLRADSDVPALVAACQDPEVARWTRVPEPYDEQSAEEWAVEANRQRENGQGLHLAIADAETGEFLGSIGTRTLSPSDGRWDIGYFLAPGARGRGVMTKAVQMLSRWIFENLPAERIEITIEPENQTSRAVAERSGYRCEGILRSYLDIKGRRRDAAMYSLLREDLH